MKRNLSSKDAPPGKRLHSDNAAEHEETPDPDGKGLLPAVPALSAHRPDQDILNSGTTAPKGPLLRSIKDYEAHEIIVEVRRVEVPAHRIRPIDTESDRMKQFIDLFQRKKYGRNNQLISVGLDPDGDVKKKDVLQAIQAHAANTSPFRLTSMPGIKVFVVDGAHRLHALQNTRTTPVTAWIPARLLFRKDNRQLQIGDFHTLGFQMNDLGRQDGHATIFDTIHSCLSTINSAVQLPASSLVSERFTTSEIRKLQNARTATSVSTVRNLLRCRGLCHELSPDLQKRYCIVALGLYRFPSVYDILRASMKTHWRGDGLTLLHVSDPQLWMAEVDSQIIFNIQSLARLDRNLSLQEVEISKAVLRIQRTWNFVRTEFEVRSLPQEQGLALLITHPRDDDYSESVLSRMKDWMNIVRREELEDDGAWEAKEKMLRAQLHHKTHWGDYISPTVAPEAPSPFRLQSKEAVPSAVLQTDVVIPSLHSAVHDNLPLSAVANAGISSGPRTERRKEGAPPKPDVPGAVGAARASSIRAGSSHTVLEDGILIVEEINNGENPVPNVAEPSPTPKTVNPPAAPSTRRSRRTKRKPARFEEQSPFNTGPLVHKRDGGPSAGGVLNDADGFQILRRTKTGFVYIRPEPRMSGFQNVTPDSESESGALAGDVDGYKYRSRLYFDQYDTTVRTKSTWTLSALPSTSGPIWRLKYKMPHDRYELYDKSSACVEAFLRSLGFRPPHQAFWRLNAADVSEIRFSVATFMTRRMLFTRYTETWQSMMDDTFRGLRTLLDAEGYVVIPEFIRRDAQSSPYGAWARMFQDVDKLYSFFGTDSPVQGDYTEEKKSRWSRIRNNETVPDDSIPLSDSRWTTTSHATNSFLETEERAHLLRARCVVEVSIWMLVHFLHLEVENFDDISYEKGGESSTPSFPQMYATDSGSHVLVTSENCSNQLGHTDFMHTRQMKAGKRYPEVISFPGYFFISTGPEAGKLWIQKDSHRYLFLDDTAVENLSKAVGLTQLEIPPWSTIVARGDFIHGGMGHEGVANSKCVRLHDYALRHGVPFADTIDDKKVWKIL